MYTSSDNVMMDNKKKKTPHRTKNKIRMNAHFYIYSK